MITLNAEQAKVLADPEWGPVLEALPPSATMEDVLKSLEEYHVPLGDVIAATRQARAFWNAQANMVRSYRTQAEDWRKIVEGLRAELDGLRPE